MKLIPCRICGATPTPKKSLWRAYWPSLLGKGGGFKAMGRYTWFVCECGLKSAESTGGVKQARVFWNDENLEAYLQRQLIEATKDG